MNKYEKNVFKAKNLKELCDALNEYKEAAESSEDDELRDEYMEFDASSLPTFGPAPYDTADRWSWDEDNFLHHNGECWEIEPRSKYENNTKEG